MSSTYKLITETPGWLNRMVEYPKIDTSLSYAKVPLVFRAIRLRADAIRSIPVKISSVRGRVQRPWMFAEQIGSLLWRTSASLDLAGAAYWEKIINPAGIVKDVRYRNPYDMTVGYRDGKLTFRQSSSRATWTNDLNGDCEIVYFTEYDPSQDLLPGVGAAMVALQDVQLMHYMTRFASAFFEGGAMPMTLLGIDTHDKSEIAKTESWFRRMTSGVNNAFRILGVRAQSIQPQILTPPIKDLTIPDLDEKARREIAWAFGIPQTMLEDAANYATAGEHRLSFWEDTIRPRSSMIADTINQQLLNPLGCKLEFDLEALPVFQEDENTRSERFARLVQCQIPLPLAAEMAGYPAEIVQKLAAVQPVGVEQEQEDDSMNAELRSWQRKALRRLRDGKSLSFPWRCDTIPEYIVAEITERLPGCTDANQVRDLFSEVKSFVNSNSVSLAEELKRANDLLAAEMAGDSGNGNVKTAPVTIPSITVSLPPEAIKIDPAPVIVNVPAPVVNVAMEPIPAPVVNVSVEPAPAPVVNVPAPVVNVAAPNVVLPVREPVSLEIRRDAANRIIGISEE